ncbi:CRP-like cAMP-activated global transcriptional regulator [Sporomusa rhizae]|uniref:Crp/Fnr family transcriptional regulator n=1 Tax=Sporomusa rhizae TaxID=357999 RepID=UPI00352BA92C
MAKIMKQYLKECDLSPCLREIFDRKLVPSTLRQLQKGEILWHEKERHSYCYFIKNGIIKLHVIIKDGREKALFFYTNGSLLGFQNLAENKMTVTTATAITPTTLYAVEFSQLYSFITKHHEYLSALTSYLFHHMATEAQEIVNLSLFNTMERLAGLLVLLADEYPKNEQGEVLIPINNQELAAMVGACRNSVYNALSLFQKKNIITKHRGSLIITDLDRLKSETTKKKG